MDAIKTAVNTYIAKARRILSWGTTYATISDAEWTIIDDAPYALTLTGTDYYNVSPKAIGLYDLILLTGTERVKVLTNARNLLTYDGVILAPNIMHKHFDDARALYISEKVIVPFKKGPGGLIELSNPKPEKIFVVGLTHSGKNSVDAALEKYGLTYRHYPNPRRVVEEAELYDIINDTPVIQYIEMMDRLYPTAKFILTVREIESWKKSCKTHWAWKKPTATQLWNRMSVYGIHGYNARIFERVYRNHHKFVIDYFADRPGKLLVLDVCGGEGYEKLCPFLGLPMIDGPFPHRNRR
jgi:hypothetical protein